MRFSTRTRYGLRFLLQLALAAPKVLTLKQIAEKEAISVGYLEQIVQSLKPLGIFQIVRGVRGGFALAKAPAAISLEDVFLVLEGSLVPVQCLDTSKPCERSQICTTRPFWSDFERHMRAYLKTKTLQCLLALNNRPVPEDPMWDYTQAVHDHFLHPHHAGPLADANAIGEVGSVACGDALRLYLKISDTGIIQDAGFETFGCASAIASSSVLTDMVIGMSVDRALTLTNADIVAQLGGLPREKMHCSVMGQEALEAAIRHWRGEPAVPHAHELGKLVCKCFGVTDAQIVRVIRENSLTTVDEVTDYTKAGGACGECRDTIAELLAAELKRTGESVEKQSSKPRMTNLQRMQAIVALLPTAIAKMLQPGEHVELVDVDGLRVTVHLTTQGGTDAEKTALRERVEALLRAQVEDAIVVVEG